MISFAPTDDQLAIVTMVERVAESFGAAARGLDKAGAIAPETLSDLWATGVIALALDAGPLDNARTTNWMVLEALATADAALALALAAPLGYVQAVMIHGTAAQRDACRTAWSGSSYRGAAVLAQEPRFGFDPTALQTTATAVDGGYQLDGVKSCVPLAAGCADFLVIATVDGARRAFLVPADTTGLSVVPSEGSLGLKAMGLTEVRFDNVIVPPDAMLGGADSDNVAALIDAARIGIAAILTGVSTAVRDHLIPYLKDRVAHGTALARKQSVAFRLADMAIELPAMRWMGWRAASALEKGRATQREARQAQLYCAEQALWITDEGVQLMGGHGYMRENPVERWFRDARTLVALEGVAGL